MIGLILCGVLIAGFTSTTNTNLPAQASDTLEQWIAHLTQQERR